ncbi:RHS repeat-associated core domain-containing protein [Actinomadura rupiterrae]|uniref:RHS repeat-associated core domain-containing protein n=1 Tax=Actinomadura rupiterrae TaxID=559627 RepID=UPI0020A5B57E|nr:RHS repeat-associated core domain-containing protein [Actinomadura rupiterrae]MCP2337527.1 RHS repeat-associated protein [Actinomadura rupiterrae]
MNFTGRNYLERAKTTRLSLAATGRGWRRLAATSAVVAAASLLTSLPALAAPYRPYAPQADRKVAGHNLKAKAPTATTRGLLKSTPPVRWPKSSTAKVTVPQPAATRGRAMPSAVRAGASPISVTAPGQRLARSKASRTPAAGQVQVTVLDQTAVRKTGLHGVVFTVGRTDTLGGASPKPGAVGVQLDYSGFAQAFGGAYGTRLRLLQYPACVLTTPQRPDCQKAIPVPSANDATHRMLTADVQAAPVAAPASAPSSPASPTTSPAATKPPVPSSSPSTKLSGSPTASPQLRAAAPASTLQATVLAATAAPSGSNGNFAATDLAPSATWNVGGNTGDFNWSYPMRVPPVPGGLTPKLELGYNSAGTDGRTGNTGNQPSWIGEGFDLWPGYIERRYESCKDAGAAKNTDKGGYPGDQCWGYDNATLTWSGKGGQLIPDGKGSWHLKDDDGTRVEKLTGAANGDDDGEYWKVTTTDGVQYYFGRSTWTAGKPATNSAWTTPVFGVHSGDPCYKASGFADSWCNQAYRWNLDYVVDPRGNAIVYSYNQETNYYGKNLTDTDETKYIRGGWLDHIDYGLRSDNLWPAHAPARVDFQVSERCISATSSDCDPSNITAHPELWQDTPWDLHCDAGQDCKDNHGTLSPTFWSRKRLTKVTTRVIKNDGTDWRDVDSWSLTHEWRDADVDRDLVLTGIQHTGLAGTDTGASPIKLPAVQLGYMQMPNRVDVQGDYFPTFYRYRLQSVVDENGGQTLVSYSGEGCTAGNWPAPESNTSRCFPVVELDPTGAPDSDQTVTNWYNKYVVTAVKQTDLTGYSADSPVTTYDYQGGAAWHYSDDDGLTRVKFKTWSQFRGYGKVITRTGRDNDLITQRAAYYMRGMDGDRKGPSGGTKDVSVSDGEGASYPDHDSAQGFQIRTETYDKADGAVVAKTVAEPWHNQTASQTRSWGTVTANQTGNKSNHSFTKLADGSWRETKTVNNAFDPVTATPTETDDFGDVTKTGDEQCTTTSFADSGGTGSGIVNLPFQVQAVAATCANKGSVDYTKKLISATRSYYDNGGFGDAPTKGLLTRTDKVSTGTTASQVVFVPATRKTYDTYGRTLTAVTADNTTGTEVDKTTTTTYTTPNGLTTAVSSTTPPVTINGTPTPLSTSQTVDPATGQALTKTDEGGKTTTISYDALSRTQKVWLPGRSTGATPNYEFTYQVEPGKIVAVGTKTLHNDSTQATSYAFYDGLLRSRQTQAPGPNGGRLLTDTFYNALGKAARTYDTYYAAGAPSPDLFGVDTPGDVQSQHTYDYDGQARVTADHFWVGQGSRAVEKWQTTTSYNGESTTVTPPEGGTKTTSITDAQGRTVETRQYTGAGASDYLFSTYTYTPAGQPATITGPGKAGTIPATTWSFDYDVRGRKTSQTDPDSGTTRYGYDDLDRLTLATDARGKKIATSYDDLDRKTTLTDATAGGAGTKLADWTYDTVVKGQLTSSNRYAGGLTYTSAVSLYDNLNRPTRTYVRVPTAAGQDKLAGTYVFGTTYNLDGTVAGQSYPAAGGLAAETITSSYDADQLGRPMKLTGYVTGARYSYNGKPEQVELSTGGKHTWITNTYETGTQRLLTSMTERENIAGLDRHAAYDYHDSGTLKSINDTSRAGIDNQCFSYDPLGRLTAAWAQDAATCASDAASATIGGPAPYKQTFAYDATGNRTDETYADPTTYFTRTYKTPTVGHQVTDVTQTGSNAGTSSYGYDNAGHITSRITGGKTENLTWDNDGTLAKISDVGSGDTTFVYDTSGNRLLQKDPTGASLYLPGMELHQAAGAATATGTRYYGFGGATVAQRTSDGKVQFLASDNQGTNQIQIDASYTGTDPAQGTATRRQLPFGSPRGSNTGTWTGNRGFVGGTTNPTNIPLTHLGAREYDPALGRFISVDPVFDSTDPQSWNGYAYSDNNPTNLSDPSGLCPPDRCGAGITNVGQDHPTMTGGCGLDCGTPYPQRSWPSWVNPDRVAAVKRAIAITGCRRQGGCGGSRNVLAGRSPDDPLFLKYASYGTSGTHMCGSEDVVCQTQKELIAQGFDPQIADDFGDSYCTYLHCNSPGEALMTGHLMDWPWIHGPSNTDMLEDSLLGGLRGRARGGRAIRGCNSFVVGTRVLLADGTTKPIEKVRVGDKVLATDPKTGRTRPQKVIAAFGGSNYDHLIKINIVGDGTPRSTGVIIATEHHRFWDPAHHRWVRADQLTPGATLRTPQGHTAHVNLVITVTSHPEVHDLTIANDHTFYAEAGGTAVLVHNEECVIGRDISRQKQGRHLQGDRLYNGGGYFVDIDDAQSVLDAYHQGTATVLGTTRTGNTVVRYDGVTGFNNNPASGYVDQPTNVYMIKGSKSPSVVPINPNWTSQ